NTWGSPSNLTHGTLVSGIIGAKGVGGVTGVAPGAGIVAIKVSDGAGLMSRVLCGLAWLHANKARFNGIDVANVSLQWGATAGNCDSDPAHMAICTLVYGGMPLVFANGNSNATVPMNTYAEVISVSAINDYDGRPGGIATVKPAGCSSGESSSADDRFSTYNIAGASDFMAPGTCVLSTTVNGGQGFPSTGGGSSFSAPHVAGAVAVYASTNPSPSDAAARAYLDGVSVPISDPDGILGSGGDGARMLRLGPSPVFGQITPVSGAPSARITYTLTGFPANATVTITWEKAAGGTIALGTAQTNAVGEATGQVPVPDTAPGGPGQKVVFTAGNFIKSFSFETRPRIRFQQPSASPGATVLANGRGFAANDLLTIRWRNAEGQFVNVGEVTTNSNGNFTNLSLTVPAWAPTGANTVRMQGTLSQNTSSLTVIVPSVQIAPVRTTVNNWVNYDLSNFPPDTTVTITWTRLTGSTIDMGTVQTDEAGNASDRIRVPATPGGAGQQITFAGGGVSETVLFEVAPRIKSNTSPAVRGGQADISLRGFARGESFIIRWRNPETLAWVLVGSGTTSNTGSANVMVTVPNFAPDGANSVRADSASFNQQTNAVQVSGGDPFDPSAEPTPTPTPEPEETPAVIDTSALPLEAPLTIAGITDDALTPNLRVTLTDDRLDTTWSAVPDPVRQDARLVIELGAPHQVWGLAWLTETGGCGQLLQVEYSLDGETWVPIDPYLAPDAIGEPMVWRYFGANVEAAYLRLTIGQAEAGQSPLGCVAEAKVWGTPLAVETPTPEPLPTEPPAEIGPEETPTPDESTTDPAAEPTTDQDG
ncbi:MAG: S8 family serine peptidase, partial [Thermomicrobiales bacterium]|nr:S8 family serine peptidase [Thermomicrobiales bacterium]